MVVPGSRCSPAAPARRTGRLTLREQVKVAGRTHTEMLGSALFSLLSGHGELVLIKLDTRALALLHAHRSGLKAKLLIAKGSPLPAVSFTANVALVRDVTR